MRRELKYLLPAPHFGVTTITSRLPALSVEYPPRRVSSVYFDTADYVCYQRSNSGNCARLKMRLRWYGEAGPATEAVLELKRRENLKGWKNQYSMGPIDIRNTSWTELRAVLERTVPDDDRVRVGALRFPVLIATYFRHYFMTDSGRICVTVDTDLQFLDQRHRSRPNLTFDAIRTKFAVIECKFDPEAEPKASRLIQNLGLRWTRFSKYCYGLEALGRTTL